MQMCIGIPEIGNHANLYLNLNEFIGNRIFVWILFLVQSAQNILLFCHTAMESVSGKLLLLEYDSFVAQIPLELA